MSDGVYTWELIPNFDFDDPFVKEMIVGNMEYAIKHTTNADSPYEIAFMFTELTTDEKADILIQMYKEGAVAIDDLATEGFQHFSFKQYRNGYHVGLFNGWLMPTWKNDGKVVYRGRLGLLREDESGSRDWAKYETNQFEGLKEFMNANGVDSYRCMLPIGHGHVDRLKLRFDRDNDGTGLHNNKTHYVYEFLERGIEPKAPPA